MAAIRARLIHPTSEIIQMGDWVHPDYPLEYEAARTSDIMPMQLRSFYRATNDQAWWDILTANLNLLGRLQTSWAPGTGLVPDFAVDTTNQGRPADPGFVGDSRAGQFSFNACRVPWQIAIEYLLNGAVKAKTITARSIQEPLRQAASTPTGTPTPTLMSIANSVSQTVVAARWPISVETGSPEKIEVPRSPRTIRESQMPTWVWNGWSRPSRARMRAMSSLVA